MRLLIVLNVHMLQLCCTLDRLYCKAGLWQVCWQRLCKWHHGAATSEEEEEINLASEALAGGSGAELLLRSVPPQ